MGKYDGSRVRAYGGDSHSRYSRHYYGVVYI